MKVIWHDASILNGEFNLKTRELKLFMEFNINLDMEEGSESDQFIAGFCMFNNAKENPVIIEFINNISQDGRVFADVISCGIEEENSRIVTTIHVSLTDLKNHTDDFFTLEINSDPYEFQAVGSIQK